MIKVSACIITFNEEQTIRECLDTVRWCDEIIVVDSGSTDQTVSICESAGCKVMYHKFFSFSLQRQFASEQASNDWILFIDADERLSPGLIEEFKNLTPETVKRHVAYDLRFKTHIYGKLMRSCGLKYEKHVRFYDRRHVRFDDRIVHECLQINGSVGIFENHVLHYTYPTISSHLVKLNRYTEMWSTESFKKGKRTSLFRVVVQFPIKFFQTFILRGGFKDGFHGFLFSFMHGVSGTMKYAKLYQKQLK